MTTIMPEGDAIRKAIQWVSRMRDEKGQTSLATLIEQACIRFNLSPKDSEFMHRFFSQAQEATGGKKD